MGIVDIAVGDNVVSGVTLNTVVGVNVPAGVALSIGMGVNVPVGDMPGSLSMK